MLLAPRLPGSANERFGRDGLVLQWSGDTLQKIGPTGECQAWKPQTTRFKIPQNEDIVPGPATGGEGERLSVQRAVVNYNRVTKRSVGGRYRHPVDNVIDGFASIQVRDFVSSGIAVETDGDDVRVVAWPRVSGFTGVYHPGIDDGSNREATQAEVPPLLGDAVLEDGVGDVPRKAVPIDQDDRVWHQGRCLGCRRHRLGIAGEIGRQGDEFVGSARVGLEADGSRGNKTIQDQIAAVLAVPQLDLTDTAACISGSDIDIEQQAGLIAWQRGDVGNWCLSILGGTDRKRPVRLRCLGITSLHPIVNRRSVGQVGEGVIVFA